MTDPATSNEIPEVSQEEGEILDDNSSDEIDIKLEAKANGNARKIFDSYESDGEFSDDDEPPEEILNMLVKKNELKEENTEDFDPKLCGICKQDPHKYKCPKCNIRTCSLACSKKHKEDKDCDGVRGPFSTVNKLSQYSDQNSIEDQKFFQHVQNMVQDSPRLNNAPPAHNFAPVTTKVEDECHMEDSNGHKYEHDGNIENSEESTGSNVVELNADGTRCRATSAVERFLLPNAARRHIWLAFSNDKGEDCSRHEQFSDSIFWCIEFIFKKQLEDGTVSDYCYRVQNIPETIRICTVLRQFLKPRKYGCIVSECDLDVEKLKPFMEAGAENVNLFMRVPRYEKDRYYVVLPEKSMLDNTRNRVILDHPKIIVTLNSEFKDYQVLSEAEACEIRERMQAERSAILRQNGQRGRGGFKGGRGDNNSGFKGGRGRGGFRGGNFDNRRGGFNNRGQSNNKRPWAGSNDYDGGSKRGRGRNHRGGYQNRASYEDAFDPFEPFEGPVSLPMDYASDKADCMSNEKPNSDNTGFHSTSKDVYQPRASGSIFD